MSDYIRAFQTQDDWLRWDKTKEADEMWHEIAKNPAVFSVDVKGMTRQGEAYIADTRPMYIRPLLYGDCYYVAGHIARNLARMIDEMPLFPFTEDMVLTRYGFILLAEPLPIAHRRWPFAIRRAKIGAQDDPSKLTSEQVAANVRAESDTEIVLDALGWMPSTGGIQFVGYQKLSMIDLHNAAIEKKIKAIFPKEADLNRAVEETPDEPIHITLNGNDLFEARGRVSERRGFYPVTHFNVLFGETWQDMINDFNRVKPTQSGEDEEFIDKETKFTFALFNFMNDKRVVVRRHALPRQMRRHQAERPNLLTDVGVILLRAEEERGYTERNGQPVPRDFNWQFWVREHMRTNWRTGKKDIKVSAHIKGPPDKPLRQRRIYVVTR